MKKLLIIIVGILLGTATVAAAASVIQTFGGGTGTSTPSGILSGDNGATTHLNTVVIGSGLTYNGTTLSASGGTFNALGLGFGATSTDYAILATTTSTTNGLTSALAIVNSGNKYTFTPSQSGTLLVTGGGTGAATLTGCLTGNGTSAVTGSGTCNTSNASVSSVGLSSTNSTLSIGSTPVTTSGTITADVNLAHANTWTASSTWPTLNVGWITATSATPSVIPNATTTNFSASQSIAEAGNNIPAFFYPAFSYSTTTTWTGTTTSLDLGTAVIAETWDAALCHTDAGTVNIQFKSGTNLLNMIGASTTEGTFTFTTNNTFAAGTKRSVLVGTPASAPTTFGCTIKKHYTF